MPLPLSKTSSFSGSSKEHPPEPSQASVASAFTTRRESSSSRNAAMGSFKAFVEIGRVCVISHGKDFGQLVVIADVVDQNRVRRTSGRRLADRRRDQAAEEENAPPSAALLLGGGGSPAAKQNSSSPTLGSELVARDRRPPISGGERALSTDQEGARGPTFLPCLARPLLHRRRRRRRRRSRHTRRASPWTGGSFRPPGHSPRPLYRVDGTTVGGLEEAVALLCGSATTHPSPPPLTKNQTDNRTHQNDTRPSATRPAWCARSSTSSSWP